MTTDLKTIAEDGRSDEVNLVSFGGGDRGQCIQMTQGIIGGQHDPGFIQMTRRQAREAVERLNKWLDGA